MIPADASVIIPAFGPSHLLDACLEAVSAAEEPLEVIVWDDGVSGDRTHHATVELGDGTNHGFAGACNRAADAAHGRVLVLLNCDTEPREGWLTQLTAAFDDSQVGIAGGRLERPDGSLQHAGITIALNGYAVGNEINEDLPTRDVDGVTGACLAIRTDLWRALGGLCTDYRNGYEDVDLCIRATRAGWRIRYVREANVMHHESATGPERWTHLQHNIDQLQRWAT